MVTGKAPHKVIEEDPGAEVRLEMARRAAAGEDGVEASDLEVGRDEVSYTYRTLELLADQDPEGERIFLLGADMAAGLASWRSRSGWWSSPDSGSCRDRVLGWGRCVRPSSASVPPIGPR